MGFSLRRNPDGVCRKNTSMNEESITYRHIRSPKVLILGEPIYFSDRLVGVASSLALLPRVAAKRFNPGLCYLTASRYRNRRSGLDQSFLSSMPLITLVD